MKRPQLEQRILHLWMTSRVPLTRANIQFYTGVERARLEKWLDELVGSGMLDVDSDDAGEMVWTVIGADRPARGATNIADVQTLESLKGEVSATSRALVPTAALGALLSSQRGRGEEHKSLVASGALSFFLGPLGWLYAAPLREAAPAILVFLVVCKILPYLLLGPLLGIAMPLSALAGVAYAWRYNQRGERTSLTDLGRKDLPPRRP